MGARRGPGIPQPGVRGEAHRGDVACRCPTRAVRSSLAAADAVLEATERADAVALGPGLGREPGSFALAIDLIERIERPLLIDADALNALAGAGLERAAGRDAPDRADAARRRARPAARPALGGDRGPPPRGRPRGGRAVGRGGRAEGRRHARRRARRAPGVSRGGAGALATAGTGDVLSGVGGGVPRAGTRRVRGGVRRRRGPRRGRPRRGGGLGAGSVVAGDVIDALPAVLRAGSTDGDSRLTGVAELTVGDVMERDPVTIAPDADLETLLSMLRENELPGLPVVEGDRLVSIVTESDLVLQAMTRACTCRITSSCSAGGVPRAAATPRGPHSQGVRELGVGHDDHRRETISRMRPCTRRRA